MSTYCISVKDIEVTNAIKHIEKSLQSNSYLRERLAGREIDRSTISHLIQSVLLSDANKNDNLKSTELNRLVYEGFSKLLTNNMYFKKDSIRNGHLLPNTVQYGLNELLQGVNSSRIHVTITDIKQATPIIHSVDGTTIDNSYSFSDFKRDVQGFPTLKSVFELMLGSSDLFGDNINNAFKSEEHFKLFLATVANALVQNSPNSIKLFSENITDDYFKNPSVQNNIKSLYKQATSLYENTSYSARLYDSKEKPIREYVSMAANISTIAKSKWSNIVKNTHYNHGLMGFKVSATLMENPDKFDRQFDLMAHFMGFNLKRREANNAGLFGFYPYGVDLNLSELDILAGLENVIRSTVPTNRRLNSFSHNIDRMSTMEYIVNVLLNKADQKRDVASIKYFVENSNDDLQELKIVADAALRFFENEYGVTLHSLQADIANGNLQDLSTLFQSIHNELKERYDFPYRSNNVYNFEVTPNSEVQKLIDAAPETNVETLITGLQLGNELDLDNDGVSVGSLINFVLRRYSNRKNELIPQLITKLMENNPDLARVRVKLADLDNKFGTADLKTDTITLNRTIPTVDKLNISFEEVFFHELMHMATMKNMSPRLYKETSKYLSEVHRAIKNELYKKYSATLSKDQAISKAQEEFDKMLDNVEYQGLKNPEEFFAELFRSPNLMRVLNKLDATGTVEVKENFFTKLLNLIAELFNFNRSKNSISKVTAFEEGKQLLSDALFLNSKKIIDLQTGITENKTKLNRSIELRKKEQIYKAAINRSTGDFLVELFNKLLEAYPIGSEFYEVVSDMIKREVSNPRGYSNLRQFIAASALYNSQFINSDINDNISPEGVLSVAYKQAFEKWVMTPANLKKMANYPVSAINSHLRTKDYALYIVDGNLRNLPMVYHNTDTYVLYQVSQNHHRLIPIGEHDSQKGMFVKIEDGVISRGRVDANNQPYFTELSGYVAPALYRKVPQTKHEKLMNDYNRDVVKIMDRSNMLLGMVRNQINEWEKESPEKSREEVINSHPYMDIYKSLVDKLNEYKEFTDESDPEFIEYSLVLDNLDALIDTIIYDLRITEGIVLKDISLNTEQTNLSEAQDRTMITKSMIKNKEAIQDLSEEEKAALFEEDLEDDDESSQKETYMLRADAKSVFDRTSMKVKRALYNVTYPVLSDQYMDDLGHERRVPLMELKDAIITVLRPLETPSEMIQLLQENTDRFPYFESLINMLEADPLLFTGFYNAFKTFYVEGAIITNNSNPFFSLSRNSIKSKITDGWVVNMIDGIVLNDLSIYSTNININKEALRKKIDELMNYIDEFNKTVIELSEATPEIKRNAYAPLLYRLENMLGAVGIDVNYHELDLMFSRSYNKENKTLVIQSFSRLTNRLKLDLKTLKERDIDKIALTNDLVDSFKGTINEVFKKYVNSIPIDGEAFVVQGGKGYYLNRPVSYISSIVKGINNFSGDQQKLDQFFSEKFHYPGLYSRISPLSASGKFKHYSNLLNDLYNDPSYRKAFGYSTAISIFGEEWKKLEIDSHALGRVYAYMSEYNTDYGYFQLPTLSDSPELGFLKMKRYKGEDGMNEIANNLANLIQTEINRIQLVNRRSKMDDTIKITNFDILDGETSSNGSKFVNFAFLESPSNAKLKSQLLSSEYTDEQKHELLLPAIHQYMNELVEDFKEAYPEIVQTIAEKYEKHDIDALLTEYMYNDYNATAEILHMLGIDMAFYKNPVDFQKRFKQVYASGIPLNTEAEIPTFEFNASTGVFTPKPGFERVGKTHRNVMVLADFMQYSTINDAMIDSLEKIFPDISKRSEIAKKLGVYNEVREVADKKDSTKNIKKYYYNTKNHLGEDISFEISPMNITDGQSFLSLDEIRTVNAMADRHSPEMERAYVAYKQTGDDRYLSEMLSSIKSFYYSDLRTPSGDTMIPDIKNNIQIKHSESVLLKYALVKSSPILNAISEFLNDPQNLGDPNGVNKIDSISFESTQKVGLTYKVNINNMTGDEIKAKLYEAAKNGEYITLDYNNYVIQQPTKNHITENYDLLVGSQLRRILIGDIPNDTTFNIGNEVLTKQEYIDVLNGIINEQIKRSFNELKDELQDPVKLSVLLKRAVISNNRYHHKLLDAFELDNHGQFKIPLFSPQNSILVQEMIMSIIKNTVVKRKIHGGKVVNTSNIGYADSLHIQFDSNNNPQYFEAYMPWFGTKEEYDAIHDEKGSLLLDKIDDKLLNTIFYRVPTEDNYSIIPIRIKGFLPPSQGVSIILPSEISALTGLDFDIDSMYGFIYNYYTTKDKSGNIQKLNVIPSIFGNNPSDMSSFENNAPKENIKPGVSEIFDSNPELANQIYEALGFNNIFENKILNGFHWYDYEGSTYSKDDFDKEIAKQDKLKPNNVVKIEYKQTDTPAGDMFNVFYVDNIKAAEVLNKYGITKSVEDFIKESLNEVFEGNEKLAIDELYGEQTITLQQKQQAQQLYSEYLDTIFPESKVKDIVYHGTKSKESFEEYKTSEKKFKNGDTRVGFYFTKEKGYAEEFGRVIPNIINTINPIKINEEVNFGEVRKYQGKNDAVIGIDDASEILVGEKIESYVVFEPEQIHILGSKQDIEGFKEFVGNGNNDLSEKNIFTVEPIQSVDKKAKAKAKIATQYIGFAEGITNSSTALYAQQAGKVANTGNYSSSDTIFVSIGGKRGNEAVRKAQQDKTIKEAIKALEAGATLITDNAAYVESNSYNEGEKRLAANLKAKGYNYSETTVDGHILGVWNKGINQITPEQKQETQQSGDETSFPYKIERSSKEELDNSFIDMALAVQNHPISAEARMDPGGFDRLREASVNIQIAKMGYSHNEVLKMSSEQKQKLLGSTIMDVNNPMTNHYFTAQNINASGNIGIFANAKSFHSLATTLQKIRLVPKDRNNYAQHLASAAKLLGIEDFNLARMNFTDSNGVTRRISKEVAEDIAAAVDAVKDPVHPLMGINKDNINVYVGLRLLGIDNYKIFYIINNAWDGLDVNYDKIKSSLKSYRPTLINDFGTISKLFTNDILSKMTNPKDFESTVKELVSKSNLKNSSYTDVTDQFIRAMMVINDFGKAVSQVILSTRYDSQNAAPSGSFSKMYSVIKKRNELFENGTDRFKLEISDDYYNNFSNTMYQHSYVEPMEILKTLFNTSAHELIFGLNPKISEKRSENILTDAYTDYITDSANNLYNIHREEFNKIFPNYFLEAIRETPYATKEFFRSIAKNMRGELYLRTVKEMDTNLKDQFISEWELLYGDSRYKNLAVQLALYAIKVQGFGYNTRNFSFLIPSIIMEEVGDLQAINENPEILYDYIILNAIRHITPQRMDWMIKSGIIDIKESDNNNDIKLKLEVAVNSGKIKGIGETIGRFFSTSDGLIFYVDRNNKVYTQKEMIEKLEISDYLKNTKYENLTSTEEFATVEDSKNLPNKDSYLKQHDVDYYNAYINNTDQEVINSNNLVSEESMLESMLYSNELFNEIKELENYRYIVESFEKELIAYKETIPEKYQHLVEDITIGLNPLSSNSNEQYLFTLPEVKDMSEEEVMKIVDDMRKCGVKI